MLPPSLSDLNLSRRDRLIVYYILGLAAIILLYTTLYNHGMRTLEDRPQPIYHSLQTVIETMTTTGYGADSPWESPVMNGFMVFMQLTGIGVGFFTLRVIIIPLFTGAEVDLDSRLSRKRDHVIICEYRRDATVLLDELRKLDIEYVLITDEEERAKDLSDRGYAAIDGSPLDRETFERANLATARAVVTDAGDANVNTILTVRSMRDDIEIIALTDETDQRDVLRNTGADSVLSPYEVLGHRLAEKAVSSFSRELTGTIDLGPNFEVVELPVQHESELVGKRIREARIRERTGATIVGAWIDGELQLPPPPDVTIRPNTVLLVSGDHQALEQVGGFTRPARIRPQEGTIVLAGLGEVGQAAHSVITRKGVDVVTIDLNPEAEADVIGDAGEKAILREAGIESARSIIVGLPDDSAGLLTTVQARSLNPDIEILVRLSDTDATRKALSAGADYVLSVPRVSARMIAKELRGEDILAPASQVRLVRVPAKPFAGKTLADAGIYEQTGCRVIAIEADGDITGIVDPQHTFSGEERIVIVGTDDAVQTFLKQYDVTPSEPAS